MSEMVGTVPVYMDGSGELFVNPAEVGDVDGEVDGFDEGGRVYWPFGRRAGERRFARRMAAYEGAHPAAVVPQVTAADLYQAAAANGTLLENQFDGLGFVALAASTTGSISDTINRNLWGKAIVLDSDSPSQIVVTSMSIAGLPLNVGAKGAPLSMWITTSTRHGISFGRKIALTGQTVVINLQNIDAGGGHTVSGGLIVDELQGFAMQAIMEKLLLTAATEYHAGGL